MRDTRQAAFLSAREAGVDENAGGYILYAVNVVMLIVETCGTSLN